MKKLQQLIHQRCMIDNSKWTGEMKYTSVCDDNFEANFCLKTLHCEQLNHIVQSWSRAINPDEQNTGIKTYIAIGFNLTTYTAGLNNIELVVSNTLDDFNDADALREQYAFMVIYQHDSEEIKVLLRDSFGLADELEQHNWNDVANTLNTLHPKLSIFDNRPMKAGLDVYMECCGTRNYVA